MPRRSPDRYSIPGSDEFSAPEGGVPQFTGGVQMAAGKKAPQALRYAAMLAGVLGFAVWALLPELPVAVDPEGRQFVLDKQARLALGLFVLAAVWWVFEVVPVGITAITIAVVQALFQIRDARAAFTDFMDPSVWFIVGALTIGTAFARTGLTNRIAYRMLALVGERVSMIYLGCFLMTAGLTLVMAHSAVAPAVFPLLAVIHSIYSEDGRPTRFGKGLFIGMAFVAGAGSIITLFGGAMSIGFCLWQTGAAQWLAIQWLNALPTDSELLFVIGMTVFVIVMTNLIMNVAAIAISLPVALAISPYLGVAPEVVLYASLAAAGMPFLALVGAAPNAIAYQSRQFTALEFFRAGIPASLLLVFVIAIFVWKIWPWMGMPVRIG